MAEENNSNAADAVESTGTVFQGQYVESENGEAAGAGAGAEGGGAGGEAAKDDGAASATSRAEAVKPGAGDDQDALSQGQEGKYEPGKFYRDGKVLDGNYVPQARFDTEVGELKDRLREREAALEAARQGTRTDRPAEGQEPWKGSLQPLPKAADFDSTEEYVAALTRAVSRNDRVEEAGLAAWRAEQDKAAGKGKEAEAAKGAPTPEQKAAEDAAWKRYNTEVVPSAIEKLGITREQLVETLQKAPEIPMDAPRQALVQGFIVGQAINGAELAYAIAQAPQEYLLRVAAFEPLALYAELGRMDARAQAGLPIDGSAPPAGGKGGSAQGAGKAANGTVRTESQAKDPPQTGRGGGVASEPDYANMPMDEYAKLMDAQEREERKRRAEERMRG